MVEMLWIAGGMAFLFVSYLLIDYFYLAKKRKLQGSSLRVLLFEKVGKDKIYKGSFKGTEKYDEKLGTWIYISKIKKAISGVSNTAYFYDKEFDKALAVCKYADDDYRVMGSLKGEVWFEKTIEQKPIYNKKGEVESYSEEEVYKPYEEPLGITQTGREAMRFNRDFTKIMREKRQEKASFWDKYGQYIMVGTMLIIILMTTAYNTNKWEKASKYMTDKFSENMEKAVAQTNSPAWINNLITEMDKRNVEEKAPPN